MKRHITFVLSAAILFGAGAVIGAGAASAGPVSSCVKDNLATQTCTLFETDANGNFSEVSSVVTSTFTPDWLPGFAVITEFGGATISDIVMFTASTAQLFSDSEFGSFSTLPPGFTLAQILASNPQIATEDASDDATFQRGTRAGNAFDTFIVHSGTPSEVPEPGMLGVFALALAGLGFLRRRNVA